MSLIDSLQIAASALASQRRRIDTVTSNIANVETTRTPEGGPYRRLDVVFEAKDFSQTLDGQLAGQGVDVSRVVADDEPPRMVYDPTHPDAAEDGFVAFPNINIVEEMVQLISASRSYEASAGVVRTTKAMANAALEIGR